MYVQKLGYPKMVGFHGNQSINLLQEQISEVKPIISESWEVSGHEKIGCTLLYLGLGLLPDLSVVGDLNYSPI